MRDLAPFCPNLSKIRLRLPDHNLRSRNHSVPASLHPRFPKSPSPQPARTFPLPPEISGFPDLSGLSGRPDSPEASVTRCFFETPVARSPLKFVFRLPGNSGFPALPQIRFDCLSTPVARCLSALSTEPPAIPVARHCLSLVSGSPEVPVARPLLSSVRSRLNLGCPLLFWSRCRSS